MEGKKATRAERGRQPMDESGLLLTVGLEDDEDEVGEEEEVDGEEKEADAKLMVGGNVTLDSVIFDGVWVSWKGTYMVTMTPFPPPFLLTCYNQTPHPHPQSGWGKTLGILSCGPLHDVRQSGGGIDHVILCIM